MKLHIERWNPFRFGRGQGQRSSPQRQQQQDASSSSGGQMSAGGVSIGLPADPLRMMGDFLRDPFGSLAQMDRWFGDFSGGAFQPRIDVVDDGDALRIVAELPGMQRQDVEVILEDEFLLLRGEKKLERKNEEKGAYRVERAFGMFERVIPLPDGVDTERAEARFGNGTLTVRLPKRAGAQASGASSKSATPAARRPPEPSPVGRPPGSNKHEPR